MRYLGSNAAVCRHQPVVSLSVLPTGIGIGSKKKKKTPPIIQSCLCLYIACSAL